MSGKPVLSRGALFAIFTISGFSGLIYQSIWSHYLKLFLGHAAYAQTLVLTVFMGGMAAGAYLAARYSLRIRGLLLGYALVEIVTGAIALVFHPVYLGGVGFAFDQVIPALDSPFAVNSAKWLIAALLILPQSVLLGATFPLISGGVVRRYPEKPGATLAMLYFTNSLGAALGVLASGFWLIGFVGLPGTVMIAGILNILLGSAVWLLRGEEPAPQVADAAAPDSRAQSSFARRVFVVAFLSGVAAFVYEIVWIRMLSLVLGSSTHAFELMLSAFILGLAFGGLVIRRYIDTIARPLTTLACMFAAMAVLAMLTLPGYGFTFDVVGASLRTLDATESGYAAFNLLSHGVAAAIMVPTTFIAGMTLPLLTHVLVRRAGESAIGRVYAANTVGAIAGVMLAVHVLLPSIGLKGTLLAGALIQLGIALILEPRPFGADGSRALRGVLVGGTLLFVAVALFLQLDPMRMASGVYRKGMTRLPDDARVVFLRDGKTATISLTRQADTVTIATNGKPDAAINVNPDNPPNPDEITMTMAAALPLAMHHDARDVANIGIGSGLTSHIVLASDRVERLDSIEIEPVMAEAAMRGYGARVERLFRDPRSHIHFEDAKTFFSAARRKYDVIISEPSNPWISGVATLFSTEFYSQVRRHLKDDGLLVQWIQIYETDLSIVASILKALSPQFADYVVYSTDDANILIIASPNGQVPGYSHDPFAVPALAAELRIAGLESLGDIEIRRIGSKALLDGLFTIYPSPANSDFFPYVDLNAPRMRFLNRDALDLVRLSLLPLPVVEILGEPLDRPASGSKASAQYFTRHRIAIDALATIDAALAARPGDAPQALQAPLQVLLDDPECRTPELRHAWLQAVHTLSASTTPFVPVSRRAPLWQKVSGARCAMTLEAAERAWLDYLAAMGVGDRAGIASHGSRMLQAPPDTLSGNQVIEVLLATAAAQIATGQDRAARELLQAFVPALQSAGQYNLALRLIIEKLRRE